MDGREITQRERTIEWLHSMAQETDYAARWMLRISDSHRSCRCPLCHVPRRPSVLRCMLQRNQVPEFDHRCEVTARMRVSQIPFHALGGRVCFQLAAMMLCGSDFLIVSGNVCGS